MMTVMTPATALRSCLVASCLLAPALPAAAQWSSDASSNLAVADTIGEQAQPKIRPTPDGGCYVSWFDNRPEGGGGYDVYLQRFDAQGVEQWPHNGVLVADRSFSSTQDYGLTVDTEGNAVLAFRDDRFGGVLITVNKVSPAGALLWGINGVQATAAGASPNSPRVAAASDGAIVVGWSEGSAAKLQRLDASGAPQWADGITLNTPNGQGSYILSDIQASDNGSVIVLLVRPIGNFLSNKHLYTQKFDAAGSPMWNAGQPVIIYDSGSVQNGYFPTFVSDGAGGAVFGWYENAAPRNCYVQRVNAAGVELFPHGGAAVSSITSVTRLSPSLAYDEATGETYLFYIETNATQTLYGLWAQKFNAAGQRQWTSVVGDPPQVVDGRQITEFGPAQPSFLCSEPTGDGFMGFCFDGSANQQVIGTRLDASGNFVWPGSGILTACSAPSDKSRLDMARSSTGQALLVWGDGRNTSQKNPGRDIFAQNVNLDGSLGNAQIPGDIDHNGSVNVSDLLAIINAWGPCDAPCPADVYPWPSGDGEINVSDLLLVITNWG